MLQLLHRMRGITLTSLLCLSLIGCQGTSVHMSDYFTNHGKDYLVTGVIAPLELPPGYSYYVDNRYPLPCPLPAPGSVVPPPLCPPHFTDFG